MTKHFHMMIARRERSIPASLLAPRPVSKSVAMLALAVTLGACAHQSTPDMRSQAQSETEQMLDTLAPEQWATSVPAFTEVAPSWSALADPILQSFLEVGFSENLSHEQALLRLESARIGLEQSRTSLRPRLSLGSGRASVTQSRDGSPFDSYSLGASASYQADLWGRIENGVTLSELSIERQEIALETLRISIAQSIALTYLDLRVQDEIIRLQEQQVEIQREQLRLSEVRLSAGAITRLSVDQIDVSIQRLLSDLEGLRATRDDLERRLATLLGRPPADLSVVPRPFQTYLLPRVSPETPANVIALRPDIRIAIRDLAAAGISLDTTRKAWLPTLLLSGSASQSALSIGSFLTADGIAASISAAGAILLFDNGDRARATRRAEISERQAQIAIEQTVLSALQDVERVLTRQERNRRQIEIQALQAEAQARVTRITQARYDTGAASAFELISEQRNALSIQQNQVRNWAEGVRVYIDALGVLGVIPDVAN